MYFFQQKGTFLEISITRKGQFFDVFVIFLISALLLFLDLFSPVFISVSADGSVLSVSPKPSSISFLNLSTLAKLLFCVILIYGPMGRVLDVACCDLNITKSIRGATYLILPTHTQRSNSQD